VNYLTGLTLQVFFEKDKFKEESGKDVLTYESDPKSYKNPKSFL